MIYFQYLLLLKRNIDVWKNLLLGVQSIKKFDFPNYSWNINKSFKNFHRFVQTSMSSPHESTYLINQIFFTVFFVYYTYTYLEDETKQNIFLFHHIYININYILFYFIVYSVTYRLQSSKQFSKCLQLSFISCPNGAAMN